MDTNTILENLAPEHPVVVVADDNPDAADSLVFLIQTLGYDAVAVYSGAQAVAAHENLHPTLIFLDINMPGVDGYEAARQILQATTPPLPTLAALTSLSTDRDRQMSHSAGFNLHIVKPICSEELATLLAASAPGSAH